MPQSKMKIKARLPPKTKVKTKNVLSSTRKGTCVKFLFEIIRTEKLDNTGAPMKAKVTTGTQKLNQTLEKAIRANIEAQVRSEAGSSDTSSKRAALSRKQTTKVAMKNIIRKLK